MGTIIYQMGMIQKVEGFKILNHDGRVKKDSVIVTCRYVRIIIGISPNIFRFGIISIFHRYSGSRLVSQFFFVVSPLWVSSSFIVLNLHKSGPTMASRMITEPIFAAVSCLM